MSATEITPGRIQSRRLLFATCMLTVFAIGVFAMADILSVGGFRPIEIVILILFMLLFSQLAFGATIAGAGFWILNRKEDPLRITSSVPPNENPSSLPPTAIVMPIFNEDVGRVFQGLRATYKSLEKTGKSSNFDFFILSDSNDPNHWVEEEKAWLEFCKEVNGFGHIFYRKRRMTLNHKSGNIADFCRRWGAHYRYMIVLDADSVMSGGTLVKLVQLMEHNPKAGIIQTAQNPVLGKSLFSRVRQFASNLMTPIFCAGANFWQLGDASYWGHNAIIRVKAFIEYCALPELPKVGSIGGRILSHDSVEAAYMRRAGYEVWCAYDLEGTYEEAPPDLLSCLQRDRRWCKGNMQHLLVIPQRGLTAASRMQLSVGIMAYASAPLVLVFIALLLIGREPGEGLPAMKSGLLFAYVISLLFIPKLLGVLRAWKLGDESAAFKNRGRLLASVFGEIIFSLLQAPILMISCSKFVFDALTGFVTKWTRQNRGEERPTWGDCANATLSHTVIGVGGGIAAWIFAPGILLWLSPLLTGLILSIPFARVTSSVTLGEKTRQWGLFLIPEETDPPPELESIDDRLIARPLPFFEQAPYAPYYGLLQAVLDPCIHAIHVSLLRWRETSGETERPHLEELRQRLLAAGPAALSQHERVAVLWDPDSMIELHKELWVRPAESLADWWRQALRHYNEKIAITTRREALSNPPGLLQRA